jgi:hypothetical protein
MCKEMLVIPVNKVVDPKRIIGKNGGPRRRKATRGRCPPPPKKSIVSYHCAKITSKYTLTGLSC